MPTCETNQARLLEYDEANIAFPGQMCLYVVPRRILGGDLLTIYSVGLKDGR
jgi:hypothetical protein